MSFSNSSSAKRLSSSATRVSHGVIAFYAYRSTPVYSPGNYHIIVYDHVVTNSGNGYNKHTGAFIAPIAGVYVFSWTTFADPNSYFPIELTVNGNRVGITSAHGGPIYNGITGVAVVQLQQNNVVIVRSDATTKGTGKIFSDQNMKTSFSGWCISS